MARRRKSGIGMRKPRKIGTEELNRQKYMSRATSGHMDSPRFGFKSSKFGKLDVCVFYAKFPAKMFLLLMVQEDEIEWLDDNTIRTSSDVLLSGDQLRKIFDHKVTYNESRYYALDETYEKRALVVRSNDHHKPFIEGESISTNRRHSRKGMTLMKTIAEEIGITPREARGILRGKMDKPEQGWAWRTSQEVDRIKALLLGKNPASISVDFSVCKEG